MAEARKSVADILEAKRQEFSSKQLRVCVAVDNELPAIEHDVKTLQQHIAQLEQLLAQNPHLDSLPADFVFESVPLPAKPPTVSSPTKSKKPTIESIEEDDVKKVISEDDPMEAENLPRPVEVEEVPAVSTSASQSAHSSQIREIDIIIEDEDIEDEEVEAEERKEKNIDAANVDKEEEQKANNNDQVESSDSEDLSFDVATQKRSPSLTRNPEVEEPVEEPKVEDLSEDHAKDSVSQSHFAEEMDDIVERVQQSRILGEVSKKAVEMKDQMLAQVQAQFNEMKSDNAVLTRELAQVKAELMSAKAVVGEKEAMIAYITKEMIGHAEAKEKIQSLDKDLAMKTVELDLNSKQVVELQAKLKELESNERNQTMRFNEIISIKVEEVSKLKSMVEIWETKNRELTEENLQFRAARLIASNSQSKPLSSEKDTTVPRKLDFEQVSASQQSSSQELPKASPQISSAKSAHVTSPPKPSPSKPSLSTPQKKESDSIQKEVGKRREDEVTKEPENSKARGLREESLPKKGKDSHEEEKEKPAVEDDSPSQAGKRRSSRLKEAAPSPRPASPSSSKLFINLADDEPSPSPHSASKKRKRAEQEAEHAETDDKEAEEMEDEDKSAELPIKQQFLVEKNKRSLISKNTEDEHVDKMEVDESELKKDRKDEADEAKSGELEGDDVSKQPQAKRRRINSAKDQDAANAAPKTKKTEAAESSSQLASKAGEVLVEVDHVKKRRGRPPKSAVAEAVPAMPVLDLISDADEQDKKPDKEEKTSKKAREKELSDATSQPAKKAKRKAEEPSPEENAAKKQRQQEPQPEVPREVIVAFSGFNDDKVEDMKGKIEALGGKVILSRTPVEATHLVLNDKPKTLKAVIATLTGAWILPREWVDTSASLKKWANEEECNGYRASENVLLHRTVAMSPEFELKQSQLRKENLQTVLGAGGAYEARSLEEADIILAHDAADLENIKEDCPRLECMLWEGFVEHVFGPTLSNRKIVDGSPMPTEKTKSVTDASDMATKPKETEKKKANEKANLPAPDEENEAVAVDSSQKQGKRDGRKKQRMALGKQNH